jgi:hypothetical protein
MIIKYIKHVKHDDLQPFKALNISTYGCMHERNRT